MGCWDIFCILCGNSCSIPSVSFKEIFENNIEHYENISDITKKKLFFKNHIGASLYGEYKSNQKHFFAKLNNIYKNTKWINSCTFLTANNKIIHGCREVGGNIHFIDKKSNKYIHSTTYESGRLINGIFVHTDCWKYIVKTHNIKLNYSYLPIKKIETINNKIFDFINYGEIEKYWEQQFDFIKAISDSNQEL